MTSKVYENIKNYIKENYKGLLFVVICFLLVTVRLPYYIEAPGGILDTKDKIDYTNSFKMKGSLNMAYVSQVDGTIPMLLYAFINPNWDISKEEEITVGSESIKDEEYRNKLLLEEANDTALLVAFKYSDIKHSVQNRETFVTYVDDLAKTNLKVGDKIISVENHKINRKQDLYDFVENKKIGDKITFKVIRDGKEKECVATLIDVSSKPKDGIVITENVDIKSYYNVDFKFKN
ncbi:MAG: PDZ domain-containing protein [Bacilli bacterium]|nr:PDZ domain-containing protein [Bacilli bacterium]